MIHEIKAQLLHSVKVPEDKRTLFFKTGPGAYAAHDRFLGIKVPDLRKIARRFSPPLGAIEELILSPYNEERLLALFFLVDRFKKEEEEVYRFYMSHLPQINNWNLVDASAHLIAGAYHFKRDRAPLYTLAKSPVMWERRIAMVATWFFIRRLELEPTFQLAETLLSDAHDLIHKAAGWMLREAGKKDQGRLLQFLERHAGNMPRTMLRYSIEKLSSSERNRLLGKQ